MSSFVWCKSFRTQPALRMKHRARNCGRWSGDVLQIVKQVVLSLVNEQNSMHAHHVVERRTATRTKVPPNCQQIQTIRLKRYS